MLAAQVVGAGANAMPLDVMPEDNLLVPAGRRRPTRASFSEAVAPPLKTSNQG